MTTPHERMERQTTVSVHRLLIGIIICLALMLAGVVFLLVDREQVRDEGSAAQTNAVSLALQVQEACNDPAVPLSVTFCRQAEDVADEPSEPIPGPPGPPGASCVEEFSFEQCRGPRGLPGEDSDVPGPPGADSTVPGPAGADSTVPGPPGESIEGPPGPAGADSTVPGPQGEPGADSTVPGPPGAAGSDGNDGRGLTGTPEILTRDDGECVLRFH